MCIHSKTSYTATLPFFGPIEGAECKPMAHAGCQYVETCSDCGAERAVNVNGLHTEEGPWGPTRAERIAAAERERSAAVEAAKNIGPVTIRRGAEWLRAEIDLRTGEIDLAHSPMTREEIAAAASRLPSELLERAKRLRVAMLAR